MNSPASPAVAAAPPPVARWLGYAGLLPFVGGAALVWLVHDEEARSFASLALLSYGALIASFLGGLHWGFGALGHEAGAGRYAWGVAPSLLAWIGLLMEPMAGLIAVGATLVLCFLVDRRLYPPLGLARWLRLRLHLTTVASLSCFLGAAGA